MFGFAKKVGMTRLFHDGKYVAVTVLEFPKQNVLQVKTLEKDGYTAVQVGAFPKRKTTKSQQGHIQKATGKDWGFHAIGEFESDNSDSYSSGQVIELDSIKEGQVVGVSGITKGRGFTGAMKRWGFKGGKASHGHDHKRAVGSIGSRWPQRVPKGKKMAGHYGQEQVTVKGLKVLAVDKSNSLIFVTGSVAGANQEMVKVFSLNA
ncbi:MAG: 50S ribosomal protein L3 [Patescibacteria group bacterium]